MEELYEQYAQLVFYDLLSLCRSPALAEELTQETFLRAMESLERFRGECRLSTWLCQIARHCLSQHQGKRRFELPEEPDASLPAPEDTERQALCRIELADVQEALNRLPAAMRRVVYLRALDGLRYQEIGRIMGKSENWARVTFFRAKEALLKEAGYGQADL